MMASRFWQGWVLVCLSAFPLAFANAQQAAPRVGYAPIADTIEQRMQACVVCHGERGAGIAHASFPRLAGQPADYLAAQMRAFRDGQRTYAPMNYLMSRQTDAYFAEIATWFSAQRPNPDVLATRAGTTATASQVDRGRLLVERGRPERGLPACIACHGTKLSGMLPAMPALAGLPRDYLVEQLGSWKSGVHRSATPNCMAQVTALMSGEDIGAVAAWVARQDPGNAPEPRAAKLPLECGAPK